MRANGNVYEGDWVYDNMNERQVHMGVYIYAIMRGWERQMTWDGMCKKAIGSTVQCMEWASLHGRMEMFMRAFGCNKRLKNGSTRAERKCILRQRFRSTVLKAVSPMERHDQGLVPRWVVLTCLRQKASIRMGSV